MTTLSDFRTLVRRDLKDGDSQNYRWTDDEIDGALQNALAEFSRYIPREMKSTIATTAGEAGIDISGLPQRIRVDMVEFPVGMTPRTFARFSVYGERLTLLGVRGDGQDCCIYWAKMHTVDEEQSTIPSQLEDVLVCGAVAYAVISLAQYHSDRANIGGEHVARDYECWGRMQLQRFYKTLRKFGRDWRLRRSIMYPATDYEGGDHE
jgi:hypothetical protein